MTPSPFFDNFYIYKWTDKIVNNKTLIIAYHIEIKDQDLRYFVGEQEDTMYEALHVGGNQVLVKQPGGPYIGNMFILNIYGIQYFFIWNSIFFW